MSEDSDARRIPSIDEWAHRRVVDVPLDDDFIVKFRLPDLRAMVSKKGVIPNPLLPIAVKVEDGGLQRVSDFNQDEREDYLELQAFVIATHLVEPNLIEGFKGDKRKSAKQKAAEWVLKEMPPGHREHLWSYCGHVLPQEAIAQLVGMFGGDVASLDEVAPFRSGRGGDDAPRDLRAVSSSPE